MDIGYSYIRFSDQPQGRGDSVRRQTEDADRWCANNKVMLDRSLTLHDLGVSAFRGHHAHKDNADRYALAWFLQLVEEGKIKRNSYLIVENLDRLTRDDVRPATMLVLGLLEAGINIVTTSPEKVYRHDSNDMVDVILMVAELARGHAESARKSDMIGKAWKQKKKNASHKIMTKMCPMWLAVEDDQFVLVVDRVAVVQRIFADCLAGKGATLIAKDLNKDKVPPFKMGKSKMWNSRAIKRILQNRAVLGEYQPHTGHRQRTPVGEPVQGYYPQIVNETDFYAAREAIKGRNKYGGKASGKAVNLFTSLVVDAEDGTKWSVHGCGKTPTGEPIKAISNNEAGMKGAKRKAIPYRVFEAALLTHIDEVDEKDFQPANTEDGRRLEELDREIKATAAQISELQEMVLSKKKKATAVVDLLEALQEQQEQLTEDYEVLKTSISTTATDSLRQIKTLIKLASDPEKRDRLRGRIAAIVKDIRVWYQQDKPHHYSARAVVVQIRYKTGSQTVLGIEYRPFHVRSNRPEVARSEWLAGGSIKEISETWLDQVFRTRLGIG